MIFKQNKARKNNMKYLLTLFLLVASLAEAKIKVVTSTTDLAWLVSQIGGNEVEVKPLLRGMENPHYVDTVPDFIRYVADAQMVCLVGLDLEIGWMPKVLSKSGNASVQPGGKGYCEVGKTIDVLDKPQGAIDRSMGDVHPSGNPHFWMSPVQMDKAGIAVLETLKNIDPAHGTLFEKNKAKLSEMIKVWVQKNQGRFKSALSKIQAPQVLEYHKEFSYFFNLYGISSWGSLEEKPGVPPSAGRIAEVSVNAKNNHLKGILAAEYNPQKTLDRFNESSGVPVLKLATSTPLENDQCDYVKFHNQMVDKVLTLLERKTL
jgi:zinc/manganese transport system substrate-binding protein